MATHNEPKIDHANSTLKIFITVYGRSEASD